MRLPVATLAVLLACLPLPAASAASAPPSPPAPAPTMKADSGPGGLKAMLLITADPDWEEKWNTPAHVTPEFATAHEVTEGGELAILTFISTPALDAEGNTDVVCRFRIVRPDGRESIEPERPCFNTRLATDPANIYLTTIRVRFLAEPADPKGRWDVSVEVTDRVAGITLTVADAFELK